MRALRRLGAVLLPERLKAPLRARLWGQRPAAVRFDLQLRESGPGAWTAVVDGALRLELDAAGREEFESHFSAHGESVEEMHRFVAEARKLPAGSVFFDVGAHSGIFTTTFCALCPGGRAAAFEPSPGPLAELAAATARNGQEGRVIERQVAVGDRAGQMDAWLDSARMAHMEPAPPGIEAVQVECVTLDTETDRLGAPALVKIDVEGWEDAVLRGAGRVLAQARPIVFLELHLDVLESRGIAPRSVTGILERAGYRFETPTGRRLSARAAADTPLAVHRIVALPA